MPSVQMNVRIDADLKAAGDAVFSSIGMSTTQAVRALWELAARHSDDPGHVMDVLRSGDDLTRASEIERKREALRRGIGIADGLMAQLGIERLPLDDAPYEAVREEALYEKMRERGLA